MKQFILTKEPKNNIVTLTGDDYKYLVKVRRFAVGESFPALLPNGKEILIKVITINNCVLTGECVHQSSATHCSLLTAHCSLLLFQALPKGDKMDLIVRQAAETGIAEIVPFVSEFSVAKKNISGQKFTRWERIIKEARQQSGSKTATAVRQPLTLSELFEYWDRIKEKTAGLLFHHKACLITSEASSQGLEQNSLHVYLNSITEQNVALVIGPEGGLSDEEAALFIKNGFAPFTIGDTILRTETAALYCAAAVKIILMEKDKWQLK